MIQVSEIVIAHQSTNASFQIPAKTESTQKSDDTITEYSMIFHQIEMNYEDFGDKEPGTI